MAIPRTARSETLLTVAGFVVLWPVLDRTADWLGSTRGEYGLVVCAVVLGSALGIEWLIARNLVTQATRSLGLGRPELRGLVAATVLCLALLAFYPVYCSLAGVRLAIRSDWALLLPGLFAQGGIAEEVIFRGFLFRRFRATQRFWPATAWSSIPFVLAHLSLYLSTNPTIATTAVLLALSISFPLAWLFEKSGGSIWPGAVVHFVIQGSIKLVEVPATEFQAMAIAWIALSGTLPWLLFAYRGRPAVQSADMA